MLCQLLAGLRHHDQVFGLFDLLLQQGLVCLEPFLDAYLRENRFKVAPYSEEGLNYDVNIAHLILEWVTSRSIIERRDREVKLSLEVTLLVILFHF